MSTSSEPPPLPPPPLPAASAPAFVQPTKRRIKRVAPLQLGKMAALLYGTIGLLFLPVFLLMALVSAHAPTPYRAGMVAMGTGFAIGAPLMYAAFGFVGGVVSAALYNVFAKWIGGIEVEVE